MYLKGVKLSWFLVSWIEEASQLQSVLQIATLPALHAKS